MALFGGTKTAAEKFAHEVKDTVDDIKNSISNGTGASVFTRSPEKKIPQLKKGRPEAYEAALKEISKNLDYTSGILRYFPDDDKAKLVTYAVTNNPTAGIYKFTGNNGKMGQYELNQDHRNIVLESIRKSDNPVQLVRNMASGSATDVAQPDFIREAVKNAIQRGQAGDVLKTAYENAQKGLSSSNQIIALHRNNFNAHVANELWGAAQELGPQAVSEVREASKHFYVNYAATTAGKLVHDQNFKYAPASVKGTAQQKAAPEPVKVADAAPVKEPVAPPAPENAKPAEPVKTAVEVKTAPAEKAPEPVKPEPKAAVAEAKVAAKPAEPKPAEPKVEEKKTGLSAELSALATKNTVVRKGIDEDSKKSLQDAAKTAQQGLRAIESGKPGHLEMTDSALGHTTGGKTMEAAKEFQIETGLRKKESTQTVVVGKATFGTLAAYHAGENLTHKQRMDNAKEFVKKNHPMNASLDLNDQQAQTVSNSTNTLPPQAAGQSASSPGTIQNGGASAPVRKI